MVPRNHFATSLCDADDIFGPAATEPGIIETRFHRRDHAGSQSRSARGYARSLVNFEPETVTGPMEKSFVHIPSLARWITFTLEILRYLTMNPLTRHSAGWGPAHSRARPRPGADLGSLLGNRSG